MTTPEQRRAQRQAGKCIRCGKPSPKSACPECSIKMRIYMRKRMNLNAWRPGSPGRLKYRPDDENLKEMGAHQ